MKKIFSLVVGCLLAANAAADVARPNTIVTTQQNGETLTLRIVGDEHFHYFLDVNTGRRMQLGADGNYTVIADQDFLQLQTVAQQRMAKINAARLERLEKNTAKKEISANGPHKVGTFNPSNLTGQKKGLVILANFTDLSHSLSNPRQAWDDAFNQVGYNKNGHVGSVHDYFYDQSYGKFDLEFDVVGPVTVSRNMSYYGQNNSYGSDAHAADMVAEACKLVKDQVNFKDYDWDGDGEVDQVYVIYAGYGESSGAPAETIWPHEYKLEFGPGKLSLDGVIINTYACSCELRGKDYYTVVQNGIGTACHEFSHCIGYPDFYDVDYNGGFGMDNWDVMCSGGYNGPSNACEVPVGFTAYERWMAGWLTPTEITEGCYVENMPSIQDEPVAYIMRNKSKGTPARPTTEYFLLENRQATKWFAYPAGAHGMLVTHVDYTSTAWMYNTVNTDTSHQRMTIVPAGKTYGKYDASAKSWQPTPDEYRSMLFPGSQRVTEWTNESHYDYGGKFFNRNTDGTYTLGLPVTEIAEKGGLISFTVKGGPDYGYRWNVNFDAGDGTTSLTSWTQKANNEKITLPTATCNVEGWRFLGWTPTKVSTTTDCPTELYEAGTKYKPSADVTLYAVYAITDNGPLLDDYELTDNFVDGQKYLLLSKNAVSSVDVVAVDPTKLVLGTATKNPVGTVVNVDFEATTPITTAPAAELVWTAQFDDERIMLTDVNGNYLLLSNAGFTLTDTPCYVAWNTTYGLYGVTNTGSSYFVHTSSGKFTVSTSKQKSSRVYLYALTDFRTKAITYTTTPSDCDGIQSITTDAPAAHSIYYDLQGRKVTTTAPRGIYVSDGKAKIFGL